MAYFIGLISGTSMDGIDAALCDLTDDGHLASVVSVYCHPYPEALRDALLQLQLAPDQAISLSRYAELDRAAADAFSAAAHALLRHAGVDHQNVVAIGSHGQTVFHDTTDPIANSLQIGDPNRIAASTGLPVVADFRRLDIALGGQGAPLVPAFHADVFASHAPCVVINIGGIANVTRIGKDVRGYDSGPGNALMDEWALRHLGRSYDAGGQWARTGKIIPELLHACLSDAYFVQQPPKSTGRDVFNLAWLALRFPTLDQLDAGDVQCTLCELTARSILDTLHREGDASALYVCGGGARNTFLMERLQALSPSTTIASTDVLGLSPDWVEAAAFAWLAWRRLSGKPGNLPSVTGASRPVALGGLYQP